jgi:hypothetical protein
MEYHPRVGAILIDQALEMESHAAIIEFTASG